ncbi:hypothetical protein [Thermovibrio sp.]
MEDSFSILGLDREVCSETAQEGRKREIKYFVFEDLLDTNEKLICYSKEEENFGVYSYHLLKRKSSLFSREEEKKLGCYLGYKGGTIYTFEDFNFKINSLEEFTLLTEAVEITTGISFFFELCNLCQLPEELKGEADIILSLFSREVKLLPPLTKFDQIADENRELLKLAVKGNEKAIEKLEREVGEEEARRLLREIKRNPQELFDTCILYDNSYFVVGIATSLKEVEFKGKKLYSIDIFAEELELTVLTPNKVGVSEGERLLVSGRMFGIAIV